MALASSLFRVLGLGAALLMATPSEAQDRDFQTGNFRVRVQVDPITDEDRSVALLFVRSPADDVGMISWMCVQGGVQPGVRLITSASQRQPVVWRFDADRPDTTHLEALSGASTWFVPRNRIVAFTARAKTANRLVIRVLGRDPTDYVYDLTGSTAALNRLPCARAPQPPATFVGQGTARKRPSYEGEDAYELSAVDERPSPINTRELLRVLEQSYPPLLRDARVMGMVEVRMRVLPDGSVDTTSIVITRSTHEQFNQPTVDAVSILRFRPAKVDGRPVRVWVELPIQWTVQGPPADSTAARPKP